MILILGKKNPPTPEELAEKFLKRREFVPDSANTSLLFMFFAQHFTHQFFKTEYKKHPGLTWGRQGIDVSHIYGQGVETENKLRTFKDGKLKSQVSPTIIHLSVVPVMRACMELNLKKNTDDDYIVANI